MMETINLNKKFESFDTTWDPKIIAALNGQQVKLAQLSGSLVWHSHADEDELFLVGTAEVPATSLYMDEILDEDDLPKRFVAQSLCFRREAGAAGKDTYGLYRIHQFEKVEQVIICRNDLDEAERWHQHIVANSEEVLQALELPYRLREICTGDMGMAKYRMYDIETYMPSRGDYCETHSASNLLDFQARRLNLRYRDTAGKIHHCITMNNTVIASPRILIALLECNQNEDGSVTIPEILRPYLGGRVGEGILAQQTEAAPTRTASDARQGTIARYVNRAMTLRAADFHLASLRHRTGCSRRY